MNGLMLQKLQSSSYAGGSYRHPTHLRVEWRQVSLARGLPLVLLRQADPSSLFLCIFSRSCFWLSVIAGACDSLCVLLNGYLVMATTSGSLDTLAAFQAIAFGGAAAATLWNWRVLCSRCGFDSDWGCKLFALCRRGCVMHVAKCPSLGAFSGCLAGYCCNQVEWS